MYDRRALACVVWYDILRNIFCTIIPTATDKSLRKLSHLGRRAVRETASWIGVILNYVFESK